MNKKNLNPSEKLDELCQRYGDVPVCRSFAYGRASTPTKSELQSISGITNPDRVREFVMSTGGWKRDGNKIDQGGWKLENFLKNPVFLWCHDRVSLPIGRVPKIWIGRAEGGKALRGWVEFATDDLNPFAEKVFRMYDEGFLNATSVSWKPLRYEIVDPEDEELQNNPYKNNFMGSVNFLENEMMEDSACPVPVDPGSLIKRIQEGYIRADEMELKIESEYTYDDGKKVGIFYVDGHEFKPETRTIHDMKVDEQEEDDEDFASLLDSLRKEGNTTVQTLILSKTAFKSIEEAKKWCTSHGFHATKVDETENTYRFRQKDPGTCEENSFRTISMKKGVKAVICKPKMANAEKTENKSSSYAIPFSVHGKTNVVTGDWNPSRARSNFSDYITKDQSKTFAIGFAYRAQVDGCSRLWNLFHHDVREGKFVTVKDAVYRCAQRIQQGTAGIEDSHLLEEVRQHFVEEYENFSEKAPWLTVNGKLYEQVHRALAEEDYADDAERDELRSSAKFLANQIYGKFAIVEPWERATKEPWIGIEELLRGDVLNSEVADEIIEILHSDVISHYSNVEERIGALEEFAQAYALHNGIPLNITNIEEIRALKDGFTRISPEIQRTANEIRSIIGEKEVKTEVNAESLLTDILRMVEAQPSECRSELGKEK